METGDQKRNWKETMQRAEVSPSASVWQGIEMQLDKDEVVGLRKTVSFYKYLAAACVVFALVAFGISSWMLSSAGLSTTQEETVSEVLQKSTTDESNDQSSGLLNAVAPEKNTNAESTTSFREKTTNTRGRNNQVMDTGNSRSNVYLLSSSNEENTTQQAVFEITNAVAGTKESAQANQQTRILVSPIIKEETKAEALAFSDPIVAENKKENKKQTERFWTSVGFAAGSFNNTTPSSSSAPATMLQSSAAGQTAASESNSPGYSYALNVGVGTKVSKRWLV